MSKIKEWCQMLVDSGAIPQLPANIDAAIYEQYAKYLESENAELRARLDKAVKFPRVEQSPYNGMFNGQTINDDTLLYYIEDGHIKQECFNNKFPEQLKKRLAELKGEVE